MRNPIATKEQSVFELKGLELFKDPRIIKTMEEVKEYWIAENNPSVEMLECFSWAFEEVMFAAVIWSSNQDPLYPAVITITRLTHELQGHQIPGTRWGIDNPDSVYRVIPISGNERYIIHGKVGKNRLTENYFTLWDDEMKTVDVLNGKYLKLENDGSFIISVDSEPANGRANHIQSNPRAHQFYIRDVMLDWANEELNELSIERLGPEPSRPPFSFDKQIELTAEYMWRWARDTVRWNAQPDGVAVNTFKFTIDRDTDGALRNQIYILGKFNLPSEEHALIVTISMGGADYFVAPLSNEWGTTYDILNYTASLNKHQSVVNKDGTYTYVLAAKDPGVHNWLNSCGYHEGTITLRWAEFKDGCPDETLNATTNLVKLEDLMKHLPVETLTVDAAQRVKQESERKQSYIWRLLEN
tara:strand:+ start:773 stop:2014 length:1242 start_codon:yes stop_codon:yes gene_type:complete